MDNQIPGLGKIQSEVVCIACCVNSARGRIVEIQSGCRADGGAGVCDCFGVQCVISGSVIAVSRQPASD